MYECMGWESLLSMDTRRLDCRRRRCNADQAATPGDPQFALRHRLRMRISNEMFAWLASRPTRAKAEELYGAVVTVARTPGYYSAFRVPDTTRGRFEMIALVLFLVLERTKRAPGGMDLSRAGIEAFVTDMVDCMREMGVGDLTVPKKVKRAAATFYERAKYYREALAEEGDAVLASVLLRHIWDQEEALDVHPRSEHARALAGVVRRQSEDLSRIDDGSLGNPPALVALLQRAVTDSTGALPPASASSRKDMR